jgi:hypothetical protein
MLKQIGEQISWILKMFLFIKRNVVNNIKKNENKKNISDNIRYGNVFFCFGANAHEYGAPFFGEGGG